MCFLYMILEMHFSNLNDQLNDLLFSFNKLKKVIAKKVFGLVLKNLMKVRLGVLRLGSSRVRIAGFFFSSFFRIRVISGLLCQPLD